VTTLSTGRYCSAVASDTRAVADLVEAAGADLSQRVPTCPEWSLRQLITHLGRAHRWAAAIVSTRSAQPLPFREVPDGRLPDDPGQRPRWLLDGAARVADALATAGDAAVWTHQGLGPAPYWARRMAHETAVHRADAEIALGRSPQLDPVIAADGIDEWFGWVSEPGPQQDQQLAGLLAGRAVHVHITGGGAPGEWTARGEAGGVTVERGHSKGDVAIRGPAPELLLVLTRRLPAGNPAVEITGDRALLAGWLAATPF
jgi:uncharacterized protein (TIGR03083 family)